MAAANFLEHVPEITYGEIEDWFLKISVRNDFGGYKKGKPHYPCDFLPIGKKERCGKPCEKFYCHDHDDHFKIGEPIPLPCVCCGEGTIQYNQFCEYCEAEYDIGLK